jgi:hypothetical protein
MTKISKLTQAKAFMLIHNGQVQFRKLSDFYQSQTSRYAGLLDSPPFLIIRDKARIIAEGFNPQVRAIVTLDPENPFTPRLVAEKMAQDKAWVTAQEEADKDMQARITATKAFIASNGDSIRAEVAKKYPHLGLTNSQANSAANHIILKMMDERGHSSTMRAFIKGLRTPRFFVIQDQEAGNVIDSFLTREEAEAELAKYETSDKAEGTYTQNFYEIVEK